jgi:nitroreductase/NAD-dependent dihydropyrimidine dehydrogenase PreA subunit
MDIIQVDRQTCSQCGVCAATCPGTLIEFNTNDYPKPVAGAELGCIRCGHCVAVCPKGSLTHRDIPQEEFAPVQPGLKISPDQCAQLLRGRRSIRAYKDQEVPREVIKGLIETARYAPTGHNNQEVEWLVIDSRAELDRIEEIGADWIRGAIKSPSQMPGFDLKVMLERQEQCHDLFLRKAPALIGVHAPQSPIAGIDGVIAMTFFDLIASSRGLGCCWAGFVYMMAYTFPPLKEALGLPPGHNLYGIMMLGYPRFQYRSMPGRKPPVITWHKK